MVIISFTNFIVLWDPLSKIILFFTLWLLISFLNLLPFGELSIFELIGWTGMPEI